MSRIMKTLTERQQRFVRFYAVSLEASQAAKAAGYSERNPKQIGHKLLQRVRIQLAIQEHLSRKRDQVEVTEAYVIRNLRENVERCMQAVPVLDKEGKPTGMYRYDAAGANKGLELLGRHLAMFTDNLKVSDLDNVPDDELDGRIDELERKRKARATARTH